MLGLLSWARGVAPSGTTGAGEHESRVLEAAAEPPLAVCSVPVGHVPSRATQLMLRRTRIDSGLSGGSEHAGGATVVYNSPILIDALFGCPWRSARHIAWSSSDQIEGTEATRGPRRPKGLVMATQGRGEHPAAASRRGTLGKKYRTTRCCDQHRKGISWEPPLKSLQGVHYRAVLARCLCHDGAIVHPPVVRLLGKHLSVGIRMHLFIQYVSPAPAPASPRRDDHLPRRAGCFLR